MRRRNFRTDRNFSEKQKRFKEKNYDYTIKFDCVEEALEELESVLGTKELLNSITKALSTYELKDILEYICKMYDIEGDFLEDEE